MARQKELSWDDKHWIENIGPQFERAEKKNIRLANGQTIKIDTA